MSDDFYKQDDNFANTSNGSTFGNSEEPITVNPVSSSRDYAAEQEKYYESARTDFDKNSTGFTDEGSTKAKKPRKPRFTKTKARYNKLSPNKKTFLVAFLGALCACLLVLGGIALFNGLTKKTVVGGSTVIGGTGSGVTVEENQTLATAVAEKCLPSVVNIDVYTSSTSSISSLFGYSSGSSSSSSLEQSSLGSGVVISAEGHVLTNYHVIEGASALKVTCGGQTYDADVVGTDASSDLAVIKLKGASGLTAIDLGDSDSIAVGEWVMSIGSPYGLEQSVATGIVSATSRSTVMSSSSSSSNSYYNSGSGTTMVYTNMIQTDAAINPGNSGGALVNANGQLIGINTLITSSSGSYSGVGFAIPANYAIKVAQQIIDGQTPTHAAMGVSTATINSTTAQRYSLGASEGAYIQQVQSGSAAEKAGVQVGDIITEFDGKAIASASDFLIAVRSKNPGDTVSFKVVRGTQTLSLTATLGTSTQ